MDLSVEEKTNPEGTPFLLVSLDGYGIGILKQWGSKWQVSSMAPDSPMGEWADSQGQAVGRVLGLWLERFPTPADFREWIAPKMQPVSQTVLRVAAQQPDRTNYHAARQLVPDTRVSKIGARK